MTLEEIYKNYALSDGEMLSFHILFESTSVNPARNQVLIVLKVKKHLRKQQYESCTITLEFDNATDINVSEDFRTNGAYSDIVLTKFTNGQFYLSVDPYGNTGEPSEMDNFVIKAEKLALLDKDVRHVIF